MSLLADSILLDLLQLPEAVEKLTRGGVDGHRGHGGGARQQDGGVVPVDILETPKGYNFFLDVPGLSKSDVQVTLEDENILVVKSSNTGKRKRDEGEEEGCRYLRLERKAAPKFVRKFRLPENSNPSAITARCENGVLSVVVEKLPPQKLPPPPEPKPKKVEVKIG